MSLKSGKTAFAAILGKLPNRQFAMRADSESLGLSRIRAALTRFITYVNGNDGFLMTVRSPRKNDEEIVETLWAT